MAVVKSKLVAVRIKLKAEVAAFKQAIENDRLSFLNIPPEIRGEIYSYVVPDLHKEDAEIVKTGGTWSLPLLDVCQQIRTEVFEYLRATLRWVKVTFAALLNMPDLNTIPETALSSYEIKKFTASSIMHLHPKEGQSSDVVSAFLPTAGKSLPNLMLRLAIMPAQFGGVVVNIGHDYKHRPGDIAEFLLHLMCLRGNNNVIFKGLNDCDFARRLLEIMKIGPDSLYQYQNTLLAFREMIEHCHHDEQYDAAMSYHNIGVLLFEKFKVEAETNMWRWYYCPAVATVYATCNDLGNAYHRIMNTEIANAKSPATGRFPPTARIYAKIERALTNSVASELQWPGIPNPTRATLYYLRGITMQFQGEFLETPAGKKLARTVKTAVGKPPRLFLATYWYTEAAEIFLHASMADPSNTEQFNDSLHRHRVICAVIGHSGTFEVKRVCNFPDGRDNWVGNGDILERWQRMYPGLNILRDLNYSDLDIRIASDGDLVKMTEQYGLKLGRLPKKGGLLRLISPEATAGDCECAPCNTPLHNRRRG